MELSQEQIHVLRTAAKPMSIAELMTAADRTNRSRFRNQVVVPLMDAGLLSMTIPDKPRSKNQQYRTTDAGIDRIREA